ncbi:MAG: hypothetical protein HY301_05060 [Verrucomicrobia bacterium]|nr:hypothetical protein [Verrucomicrobiota bacterium]
MLIVRNENLSATMEAFFGVPVPFDKDRVRSTAELILKNFGEYGLRPNQVRQKIGDLLYDYDLSFSLFNTQAQFHFGHERVFVNVVNAKTAADAEIILQCVLRAIQCVDAKSIVKTNFQAASHALFASPAESSAFFAQFTDDAKGIVEGGRIIVVKEENWPGKVRLLFERSLTFPQGVFAMWTTEIAGPMNAEMFRQAVEMFEKTAERAGFEFKNHGQ